MQAHKYVIGCFGCFGSSEYSSDPPRLSEVRCRSRRNYYVDGMVHFCTATVNEWQPLLDDTAAGVLYRHWREAGTLFEVRVLAYVIMPNQPGQAGTGADAGRVEAFQLQAT